MQYIYKKIHTFYFLKLFLLLSLFIYTIGCNKLVNVSAPVGILLTPQVFSTDLQATSAISGIYNGMINNNLSFSSGGLTIFGGAGSDELLFINTSDPNNAQFQYNSLLPTNYIVGNNFWANAFFQIYTANAIIAGLNNSTGVHDSVKNELIGEAEFIKCFCNFYLINLFGDIPLVTTIDWKKTNLLKRSPTSEIYDEIISDLLDAQKRLPSDFSVGKGQRIIPTKWAATALLARVYLYKSEWSSAESQANLIINNSALFNLSTLDSVFLTNSNEAIWQLQQSSTSGSIGYNATPEGFLLIPRELNSDSYAPFVYLTPQLISNFEDGDQRRVRWIDSTIYMGKKYYFPYKYKVGSAQATPGGEYTEYYMVLRLAEQYLIRAEARAQQANLSGAISDLNLIRARASLPPLSLSLSQTDVLTSIEQERRIELFAEWGNRWLDLKRTGQATIILSANKGLKIDTNSLKYPIPASELISDPNLTQNPGY